MDFHGSILLKLPEHSVLAKNSGGFVITVIIIVRSLLNHGDFSAVSETNWGTFC